MGKEKYTRSTQKHNNLKKVIIRIDYDGITSADKIVDLLKEDLRSYFTSMTRSTYNLAKMSFENASQIARTLSRPIEDIINVPVFEFYSSEFSGTSDNVKLEVCNYYIALVINTKQYGGIYPYQVFSAWFLKRLFEFEPFLNIKRLGIRKMSGGTYRNIDDIGKTYEQIYYFGQTVDQGSGMIRREYQDCFWNEEKSIKVNYNRAIRSVKISDGDMGFQVVLDIDVYVDEGIIREKEYDLDESFEEIFTKLNDYQYDLYKEVVTENYLEQTSK